MNLRFAAAVVMSAVLFLTACVARKPLKEASRFEYEGGKYSCNVDSDCVASSCCHSTSVVNKKYAPDCADISCTQDCSGPLDCGAGEPACINNLCAIRSLGQK